MTKSRLLKRAVGVGMVLVLPLMLGCTNMIGDKEQGILENAQKAAEGAEADLNACKQKNAELEREVAKKKEILAKLQNDRDTVQKALGQ